MYGTGSNEPSLASDYLEDPAPDLPIEEYVAENGWDWADDVWVTREGRAIKYRDLTDRHLDNIINFLGRNLVVTGTNVKVVAR